MRREKGEGVELAAGCRWAAGIGALVVAASLAGCGGGSGDDAPSGESPTSSGAGSIRVKVTDELGEGVAGASVWVSATNTSLLTGPDGTAQFDNVPAGASRVCAQHVVRGHTCSSPDPVTVEKKKVLELSLQLRQLQDSEAVAAVLSATVDPGGLSTDGKSLDVTLRVGVVGPQQEGSWFIIDGGGGLQVFDCAARTGDDLTQLGPRCVRGVDGRDASYSFVRINDLGSVKTVERPVLPWAVGLLVDQSDAGLSPDWVPNEPRLFAAKVFSDRLVPGTPLLLGAFASDEPSGSASPLPQRPVTFFPVESPAFLTSKVVAFGILDDLPDLVGGGSPLYQAIAQAVDYMAVRSPPDRQRALVVLADGADATCGTAAQCAALRREIITRARDAAVQLFIVGGTRSDCTPDWVGRDGCEGYPADKEAAQLLAREGGFPIVIGNTPDLRAAMELAGRWLQGPGQWDWGSMTVQDISLRLASDSEGVFVPGAPVMGAFVGYNASQCPIGCQVHSFSFMVEVPE